jgi:EAL domain-containing protein (putative c-di-GMP-specific phosphodiesterase class I)/GGDEF domain-containing protein
MRDEPLLPAPFDTAGFAPVDGARADGSCFFTVLSIDNFAILRRHLGRTVGDRAIHAVAERVAAIAPGAALAVVGRDRLEIAGGCSDLRAVESLLTRIETGCAGPFSIGDEDHRIEVLIGASVALACEHEELRLVEDAEQALDDARIERRPIVRALSRPDALDRIALKRDLGAAIAEGSLFLHYQPKIHLRRCEVAGVEALIRWRHPARGLISPADFIPIAEESRDIFALTLWTLRRVIEDQRTLAELGHDHVVFINVAGVLLSDPRFVAAVRRLVPASGARIGFEITETSVIRDPDSAIAHLKLFADMGITVAIDDYGAGLSSLAYLKRLPAAELKIDKLFITQLSSSHRDPLIVRSTIDLAHALDMEVVAEGVETAATLALLSVMGCDMAQGFLMSRPIAFDALVTFLNEYQPAAHQTAAPFGPLASLAQRR